MLLALALSVATSFGGAADPDILKLANGKELECRVLFENEQKVVYRAKGKVQEVPRAEVSEVQSVERGLRAFLERFEKVARTDAAALSELALFAEQNGLPGEAHNAWLRVLSLAPEDEQAWTKLGGVKQKKGWKLKVRGRFYDLAELRERVSDWKNPLELPTAHFLILTDSSPERALDAAIDLERTWQTFYDALGKHLELYVFDEVPEVHAFADPKDYPAPPTAGADAWFSPSENVLYVNMRENRERGTIVGELTDVLIFNAFRRTLGKTGQIERWARGGIAQAFAAAVRSSEPGSVTYDFSTPYLAAFQAHAKDAEPLSLDKLLAAANTAFDSGTDAARYNHQAYTLTHFLLFYEGNRYRPKLAEFLRSSYLGKGGSSNFFKVMGVDEKTLTAEWLAHVKAVAGV